MTRKKRHIVFLSFLFLYASQAQALDPAKSVRQYIIDVWTTDDGLPQNYIGKIAQTDDGYLWLATQQGLARFNGKNFRTFDQWNTPEIKAIAIQALYKGHDGTLWIGTRGGGLTGLKNGKFEAYTSRDGLSSDFISSLCEDENGNLWIGFEDGSIDILKDGKFKAVPTTENFSIINHVYRDNKGNMLVATNRGMARYSEGKSVLYSTADGLSSNRITRVYEDRSGNLWIGTEGGGLNRFRGNKFECFTTRNGLCNDAIFAIFEDRAGNLWIGTRGGLARLKNGKFESFTTKDGLSNNAISFLYEDYEGSLWIGTHNGLDRLKDSKVFIYSTENGLPNDFIWSIFEDSKRNIWIGTHGTGLVKMKNGEIENFSVKDGLPSGVVRPIWEDRKGSLWIGTLAGLVRLRNGKFTAYTMKDGLSNELIRSIYEDSKGTLWIGTDDGLNWYRDGEFSIFDLGGGLEERDVVYSILEDRERILWIATYNGLIKIKDGSYKRFDSKDGLAHVRVFSILQDSSGNMWFGTNGGGLTRLKNGKFISFTRSDGLPDNVIYRILEDKNKNLWMSSNQGIFSLSMRELDDFAEGRTDSLKPETYGKAEGMKSLECNGGSSSSGCVTTDGKLWFPTLKGAVAIDPEQKGRNEIPPPVKVENVIVDDRIIPLGSDTIFEPGARRFEFHYAALTFLAPEKVRFKFKLENFEEDWVDAERRREAYYTNVPPGFYRFRVIACNNEGVWNTEGASFEFYLKPYFYQTLWFYLVCGIGIVFSGIGVYQLRVRQLRKHKKGLEKRVEERTNELEDANKKLQQEITERTKLQQEAQRRGVQASLIYKVGQRVSSELELQALLSEIVTAVRDAFDYYGVMLMLLDEEDSCLKMQSIAGAYVDIFPKDLSHALREGMTGYAASSGKTQLSGDVSKNPNYVREANELTKSELTVPIKKGHKVIGVLDIQSDEFDAFDETDVAAMETLTTQVATAIENARLYEQAQCEIDERKVVEKQLEDFAYIVSHDLKAPLRAVNQLATWISEDYVKAFDEEGKEQMNLLIGRVKRMSSLIDGILEYSRIGRIKGKEEEVDLNIVAKETLEILVPPENIQVIIKSELPVVFGDRVRIGQVFQNLISNAMKYMDKPEGEIKIDCEDEGSHWKISVADNGPGIERKYYEKIFQIFQTLESKDTRESTGIGLTLVKKIVELHGGKIWVKSEVGKGSTFLFTIKKK